MKDDVLHPLWPTYLVKKIDHNLWMEDFVNYLVLEYSGHDLRITVNVVVIIMTTFIMTYIYLFYPCSSSSSLTDQSCCKVIILLVLVFPKNPQGPSNES